MLCRVSLAQQVQYHVADDCTESSASRSYWKIEDFVLKVLNWDSGGSMGTFGFKSYYSATNRTVECMVQDVDLAKLGDGQAWTKCDTAGTEFRFDLNDVSLTMKETWTCSGMMYNANATGMIMLHGCLDNNTDKGVESDCNLMELEMAGDVSMIM
ncbi:hypothetical protein B0H66DRAFT_485625 [Apodospora peruviana]|uniref:Uncharacterized protein n=1 Tax=Apodospora peruviana TaxID=516989 RepID=A0AAE0HT41_9PEZI|nr:hypothetical protein B0H66DRAFT_485625 [Apodospora peruviana]